MLFCFSLEVCWSLRGSCFPALFRLYVAFVDVAMGTCAYAVRGRADFRFEGGGILFFLGNFKKLHHDPFFFF